MRITSCLMVVAICASCGSTQVVGTAAQAGHGGGTGATLQATNEPTSRHYAAAAGEVWRAAEIVARSLDVELPAAVNSEELRLSSLQVDRERMTIRARAWFDDGRGRGVPVEGRDFEVRVRAVEAGTAVEVEVGPAGPRSASDELISDRMARLFLVRLDARLGAFGSGG